MLKIFTLFSFTDLVCNFSKCDAHSPKNAHLFLGASLTLVCVQVAQDIVGKSMNIHSLV